MRRCSLLLVTTLLAGAAELPVRTVILYKHGVGFFEREGALGPGESARLDFNANEMNDVLKSLTVQDRSGGKIAGLRYDSMDPLSRKLAEFPFHLGDGQPLSGTLDQLKGARVELRLGNDTLSGVIVGARIEDAGLQPAREFLSLFLTTGEMRTVDLSAVSSVRFSDPELQREFQQYFEALVSARSKEKRSVYIDSSDAKQREVVASYMIPTPVWKSSYRLILTDSGKATLEGWAIVDNTTGEDWNKVQLSLVSGRPISFVSALYAPKYVTRPTADLPDDAAAAPVINAAGYAMGVGFAGGVGGGGGGGRGGRAIAMEKAAPAAPPQAPFTPGTGNALAEQLGISTVGAQAAASELGELFEYRMSQPVTIRKDESAMLPFLQQPIEARKLLIYSHTGSEHPTNSAELINSTGKTLDGGPITVFDGGAYAGEALMETLKQSDKRLISYAVDLGTRITEAFDSKAAIVTEIHAEHGILTAELSADETRNYTIRNVDRKAKTLIIEHPLRYGYTVLNQKPIEKTSTNSRFQIALAADSTQQFPVQEKRLYSQTYQVSNLNPDQILVYVHNMNLSDAGRRALQQVADQKNQIAENDRDLRDAGTQIADLTSDEDRIRRNIESLNNVSGQQQQVQNYARQLDQHEQQLAALRDKQAELQKKKSALQGDLDRMVELLKF